MPTQTHKFRISDKRRRANFGKATRRSKRKGFPKTVHEARAKKPRRASPDAAVGSLNRVLSASIGLRRGSACYIHKRGEQQKGSRLYHKKKTLGDARKRCKRCNARWQSRVFEYANTLFDKLTKKDRKRLEALLGKRAYSGPIRASDLVATQKFGLICADVIHSYALALPDLRWFHVTLFADEFRVSERRPALALKSLKGKAYKEIHELGLSGVAWVDIDALPNYPQGGKGGSFMFHVHVLAFTERDFDIDHARQKLKRSRSWSCSLKADPTHIVEVTGRMGTPAWWAMYGAKPPYRAKRRLLRTDGTARLRWTDEGYRPQLAMRLEEGLAQLALLDGFFAIGEGKDLREDVRRRLVSWHRRRWPDQRRLELGNTRPFFRRMWSTTRVKTYKRWRMLGATI